MKDLLSLSSLHVTSSMLLMKRLHLPSHHSCGSLPPPRHPYPLSLNKLAWKLVTYILDHRSQALNSAPLFLFIAAFSLSLWGTPPPHPHPSTSQGAVLPRHTSYKGVRWLITKRENSRIEGRSGGGMWRDKEDRVLLWKVRNNLLVVVRFSLYGIVSPSQEFFSLLGETEMWHQNKTWAGSVFSPVLA